MSHALAGIHYDLARSLRDVVLAENATAQVKQHAVPQGIRQVHTFGGVYWSRTRLLALAWAFMLLAGIR